MMILMIATTKLSMSWDILRPDNILVQYVLSVSSFIRRKTPPISPIVSDSKLVQMSSNCHTLLF